MDVRKIKDDVINEIKEINDSKILYDIRVKYIGKKVKVLWEEKIDDWIQGHTTNYMVVKQKSEELLLQLKELD